MKSHDERVDAYIDKAPDYAKPVLLHLREVVHAACPDVEESFKWSFPVFLYKGEMMCTMSAFKAHCGFGFWKQSLISDDACIFKSGEKSAGSLGPIKSLADLPKTTVLKKYIGQAMALNEQGIKVPKVKKADSEKKELVIPEYFTKALKKNTTAEKAFNDFSYSHKKEYVEWLEDAKTEATRDKRMVQAIEWISEGKGRNWKYAR
jgi:uncharacterized protein YdeI (YjbR/CyaY-like superfamily)